MTRRAKTYIGVIIALGAAIAVWGILAWDPHDLIRFACYLALAIPASCLKVRLPGVTGTMSVLFLFLLAGVVELGLPETLLMGATCVVFQCWWKPKARPRPVQIFFSVAAILLAIAASDLAYHGAVAALVQPAFPLAIAASVFFLTNTLAVAAVIALTENRSLNRVWTEFYSWSFPYYLVGAAIVGMFGFAQRVLDWQSWLLIVPLVYVIYRSYYLYLDRLEGQKKRAEEQSRHAAEVADLLARAIEANRTLEAVIQASPLAIFAVDISGNVSTWNAMAQRMFGWSADEVVGHALPSCCSKSGDTIAAIVERTLRAEPLTGLQLAQWRKDGSSFEAAVWTAPLLSSSGMAEGVLLTIADVTDRMRLEEQLRVSQKMEAIGRLAGGIAHDFNNLLTIINGYANMLIEDLRSDPYARSQAEEILTAGNRAAELVSQLMSLSRRQVIKPVRLDLNGIVQETKRMLGRLIGEHIELRTSLSPDPLTVLADANQMTAIIMNLASNARDAMPEGGVLTIETARVFADHSQSGIPDGIDPGDYIRLTISDTGHGMDPATQEHIFEPFFTTKEKGKGTGLGLSSVYGCVQQNGGRICVSSTLGQGSSFSIYLPCVDTPHGPEPQPSLPGSSGKGTETILLVEDEPAVRRMIREALTKAGYRVWEAGNGADALQQWDRAEGRIHLLLSDVVMPVMNGLKLAQEVVKRAPGVPILFMSGHAEDVVTKHGLIERGFDLLPKPFLPELLVQRVRSTLDESASKALALHAR